MSTMPADEFVSSSRWGKSAIGAEDFASANIRWVFHRLIGTAIVRGEPPGRNKGLGRQTVAAISAVAHAHPEATPAEIARAFEEFRREHGVEPLPGEHSAIVASHAQAYEATQQPRPRVRKPATRSREKPRRR
jgi:hypothetical protein